MPYSSEFLTKIKVILYYSYLIALKGLVKDKLSELGAFADEELPDYIMVMVANRKKRESMVKDLQLFLGNETVAFTEWFVKNCTV